MKVIAIPTKIYDSAETPLNSPSLITIKTTIKEKMNVLITKMVSGKMLLKSSLSSNPKSITEKPSIIASAAPNEAPDATPSVRGETRGLPKLPCIKVPAVANAAPAKIAIRTRGNLIFTRMLLCILVGSSMPKIILTITQKLSDLDEPRPIEKTASITVKANSKYM